MCACVKMKAVSENRAPADKHQRVMGRVDMSQGHG